MPEEPDVSPEEEEILDRNIHKRIEEKERQRADERMLIANRITEALQLKPQGMSWVEIRAMFDRNVSNMQIKQTLQTLETAGPTSNKVKETEEGSGERRFLLAAS